ncbi:hypothetical protein M422DRAFT_246802 [Sphaerobolus stellatus SS14]|nr:hypothetical protein M422DRAFT_246802 [Sphaerobolus stellatus SS14]
MRRIDQINATRATVRALWIQYALWQWFKARNWQQFKATTAAVLSPYGHGLRPNGGKTWVGFKTGNNIWNSRFGLFFESGCRRFLAVAEEILDSADSGIREDRHGIVSLYSALLAPVPLSPLYLPSTENYLANLHGMQTDSTETQDTQRDISGGISPMPAGRRHYVKEDLDCLNAKQLGKLILDDKGGKWPHSDPICTTKYPRKVMISVLLDAKYGYTTLNVPPRPPRKVMMQSMKPRTRATTLEKEMAVAEAVKNGTVKRNPLAGKIAQAPKPIVKVCLPDLGEQMLGSREKQRWI